MEVLLALITLRLLFVTWIYNRIKFDVGEDPGNYQNDVIDLYKWKMEDFKK